MRPTAAVLSDLALAAAPAVGGGTDQSAFRFRKPA